MSTYGLHKANAGEGRIPNFRRGKSSKKAALLLQNKREPTGGNATLSARGFLVGEAGRISREKKSSPSGRRTTENGSKKKRSSFHGKEKLRRNIWPRS